MNIVIIDYGMGNLRSVQKALERAGVNARLTQNPSDIAAATAMVLPGVGAFGAAMENLKRVGMSSAIVDFIRSGRPFLGICLGLQVLFDSSEESPGIKGLGVFKGTVKRFELPDPFKVPHMGWNQVVLQKQSLSMQGIPAEDSVYFVHSYYVVPEDPAIALTTTSYGIGFVSSIETGALTATQFHPEKSGKTGIQFLKNWMVSLAGFEPTTP